MPDGVDAEGRLAAAKAKPERTPAYVYVERALAVATAVGVVWGLFAIARSVETLARVVAAK